MHTYSLIILILLAKVAETNIRTRIRWIISVMPILSNFVNRVQPNHVKYLIVMRWTEVTVYVKSFEGENFYGFRGFLITANFLPWKFSLNIGAIH